MQIKYNKLQALVVTLSLSCYSLFIPSAFAATFTDIPYSHEHSVAISYLQSNNIIEGYEDNTFRPDNKINRVEFLKIVLEGTKVPLNIDVETNFSDTDDSQWYAPYVRKAKHVGWIQGYPDGTFRPLDPIKKVEALKILGEVQQWDILALGEITEAPFQDTYRFSWYSPYVTFAKENNLLFNEVDVLNPGEEITRGYMAEIVYRSIIHDVILFKPGQTAEDKIESVNEVVTPNNYAPIAVDFFDNVVLDAPLPNTFYRNEVYILEGKITNGKTYDTIFGFLAKTNDKNAKYEHLIGTVQSDRFSIPLIFRNYGEYNFGIIPGSSGESKITTINVLNGIPVEGANTNINKPDSLKINFQNDTTTASWNSTNNNVFRIYLIQDSTVFSYLIRDKKSLNIFYKDFKNFEEGDVSLRIFGAKASSIKPLILESKWTQSNDLKFKAVTHNFKLTIDESIKYSTIPEKLSTIMPIAVSGTTSVNMYADGAIIKPNGFIDSFLINTNSSLLSYFGNDIIPAGAAFNFSYSPPETGVYILEVNDQGGSALLNVPVYIGNIIPLIPDFFDLQNPLEQVEEIDLDFSRQELLNYINIERAQHGLGSVSLRNDLNQLSQAYAIDMNTNNFFSHIDLNGGTPDSRRIDMGINTDVGENLAHAPSVYFAHKALMRSAIHRQNILNPDWDNLGIGIALDGFGSLIVVEEFSHHFWNDSDIINFENKLLDMINGAKDKILLTNTTLKEVAREWSDRMIKENFFSFTSPSGINLIDTIQNRGVTDEGRAYILKEGTIDSLFHKLLEDSDIELSNWRQIGLGLKQDNSSNLYLTVIYTE